MHKSSQLPPGLSDCPRLQWYGGPAPTVLLGVDPHPLGGTFPQSHQKTLGGQKTMGGQQDAGTPPPLQGMVKR